MRGSLGPELYELIGETATLRLAEAFGGTRLAIPLAIPARHPIADAIGLNVAKLLIARFAPDVINVPLLKDERAKRYRSEGASNARIAVRLGMTENGVEQLLQRLGGGQKRRRGIGDVIGQSGLVALAESFAGSRLQIPASMPDDHPIVQAIGADAAQKLAAAYSPEIIRVPLAHERRAIHHRDSGMPPAQIALRLGLTETAVNKLLRRTMGTSQP